MIYPGAERDQRLLGTKAEVEEELRGEAHGEETDEPPGAVTAVGDVAFDVGADGGPPDAALRATTTFDDALVTRV